jgi:ABC-type sugar transport system ATPase subunit
VAEVRWEGARKQFGGVVALHGLSLTVPDGDFLVLVGPSGSGKTTALRLLAGLESLSGGHIAIGDERVDAVPPRGRDIAMVFQDYALYPQMSVRENLAFGLRMRKQPRAEIDRRVARGAGMLGLEALLSRRPGELSGGQRQRVALGRALVREPQVFLMDEPLSNLDAKLRTQTRGEIRKLQEEIGTTTVYVTHDQVEAMTMGDRIAVMRDGRLEQVGTPDEVYERPANVFVAGFIGSPGMAFCPCDVTPNGSTVLLSRGEFRVRVPWDAPGGAPSAVITGVRPEHASLWDSGEQLIGPLEGRVDTLEALGRETFLGVAVADGQRFVVQVPGTMRLGLGETVRFGLRPGGMHLFHADTQEALGRA